MSGRTATGRVLAAVLRVLLVAAGTWIALLPAVSVHRVGGQAFDHVPASAAPTSVDDRTRFPLLHRDLTLGTRTYRGSSASEVEAALRADGFESFALRGDVWFAKPCCGSYDAVWVRLEERSPSTVEATITVADADIQATWWLVGVFGIMVAGAGVGVGRVGASRATSSVGLRAAEPSTTPRTGPFRPIRRRAARRWRTLMGA